jgi:SAM-dependent methyltransferase
MSERTRAQLRATFDQDAELYDRARPGYPAEMLADLAARASIGSASRVLEIGCGTGQLSLPLAKLGCTLVALDIGADLATIARRKLAPYPFAQVIVAAFEEWLLPPQPFDVVVSATAFHWLDPSVRMTKAAGALRPGGALAIITTHHIAGGDADFFVEVQECYQRWDSSTPPGLQLPAAADVPSDSIEIDKSGQFGQATFRRYEWQQTYSAAAYRDLLMTYSGHRALPEAARDGLLDCIGHLIDSRYGGKIAKRYLTELCLAFRLS